MKRVVLHWTAGGYMSTAYERSRYHFLIEFTGARARVVEGDKPPEANKSPLGPDYVRHAGGFNSDSIGIAICAMAGAKERPLDPGRFPPTRQQIDALVKLTADLCETYNIAVSPYTVLMHSEVRPRFGAGVYKWDINLLPGMSQIVSPEAAGAAIRQRVQNELNSRDPKPTWWARMAQRWKHLFRSTGV